MSCNMKVSNPLMNYCVKEINVKQRMHSKSLSTDSSKLFTAPNNLNLPPLPLLSRFRCSDLRSFSNQLMETLVAVRGVFIKR